MSDREAVLAEVEARVRIAERQGWANRSVPVRLLRQIANELRAQTPESLLTLVAEAENMHPTDPSQWQLLQEICKTVRSMAWVEDQGVLTHSVCRHGVTKGDHCPDCEAMKE